MTRGCSGAASASTAISTSATATVSCCKATFTRAQAAESGFIAQPPPTFIEPYTNNDQLGGGNILGRWTHKISEDESTSVQVFYDRARAICNIADTPTDIYDVTYQYDVRLNSIHKVTWGLEYRNMRRHVLTNNPFVFDSIRPRLPFHRVGGFLMDEISLIDDELAFFIGSRVSYNTFTQVEVQPTARLLWTITDRQIAWAAVSRAVRVPSVCRSNRPVHKV